MTTTIKRADELQVGDKVQFPGYARWGVFTVLKLLPPPRASNRIAILLKWPNGIETERYFAPGEPMEVLTP